jgi:2-oxo-3-hexenedioate decarboxylase
MHQMGLSDAEEALLVHIREARTNKNTMEPQALALGVGIDGAYRVQAALGEGRKSIGYKLGLISPAKQNQMGISSPIYGRIYAEMLLQDPVHLGQFVQPRLEPELAVVLKDDLPPEATSEAAWLIIDGAFLGVDFLDSIWKGYHFSAADVIADNASGGGFVLGSQLLRKPFEGELRLYLDGALLVEGKVEALGDTGERLTWLSQAVGGLQAGQVIFLGSPIAALEPKPGILELYGPQDSVLIATVEGETPIVLPRIIQ